MGLVRVQGADLDGGRVRALRVKIHGLPARTIDRDTAIHWMREGHSLVPAGGTALQLVDVVEGDEAKPFIRLDNAPKAEDALPKLPSVAEAAA